MFVLKNKNLKRIQIVAISISIQLLVAKSIALTTAEEAIIYVYDVRNNILIDFIYNRNCYSYSQNKKDNLYITKNNRLANRVKDLYYLNEDNFKDNYLIKRNHVIQFFDQLFLVDYSGSVDNIDDFNYVIAKANVFINPNCVDSRYIVNTRDTIPVNSQVHNIHVDGPLVIRFKLD